jgi:hypothetical protein
MNTQHSFRLSLGVYRKMLYFNTFFSRGWRSIFILMVWFIAALSLGLDLLGIIQPTRVMHLCFLLVSISVPLLVFGIEMKLYRIKDSDFFSKDRTVIFGDDGIDYIIDEKKKNREHDPWDNVVLFETHSLFIISKDDKYSIPVPKTGIPDDRLKTMRGELQKNLGNRYKKFTV